MILPSQLAVLCLSLGFAASSPGQDAAGGRPNLLTNPDFEEGETGWNFSAHGKRGTISVDETEKHQGKSSIRIEYPAGDDSFLRQTITVKPKTRYRFSGYVKAKGVVVKGVGANLSLDGGFEKTESIAGNKGWTKVSFEFDTGAADSVKVGPRLGHYYSMAMGVAWFDELSLVELGPSRKR